MSRVSNTLKPILSSLPKTVNFSVNWKISWSDFAAIGWLKSVRKTFVTSYNNVSLLWRAELVPAPEEESDEESTDHESPENKDPKNNGFFLRYVDGPMEKFSDMNFTIAVVKPDQTTLGAMTCKSYEAVRSNGYGWPDEFVSTDGVAAQKKYGLKESDSLVYRIVLRIPLSVFTYKIENPLPTTTSPQWLVDLFKVIDDPQRSTYSNAKLSSRDGHPFYCHKVISFQSAPLDAMFRHPPGEGQTENEYDFKGLSTASLKSFVQYLYTGQATLASLSADDLIDLADGAEQYDLKPLKKACASVFWDKVVQEPWICYRVIRFAILHDDMKYLKHRAMDVLADNWESVHGLDANRFGDGEEGKKLLDEFMLYLRRRIEPSGDK